MKKNDILSLSDTLRIYTNLVDPLDNASWMAYGLSVFTMTVTIMIIIKAYGHFCPSKLGPYCDKTYLTIRLLFGFTEPDRLDFVANSRYSTGLLD